MKILPIVALFIILGLLVWIGASVAYADLDPTRATQACTDGNMYGASERQQAAAVFGVPVASVVMTTTDAVKPQPGEYWIRSRATTNYIPRAFYSNCHIIGYDTSYPPYYGWSYFFHVPAPNYLIDTTQPNWQTMYNPFSNPYPPYNPW